MMIYWDLGSNYGLSTKVIAAVMSMYSQLVIADGCSADFEVELLFSSRHTAPYLFIIDADCILRASIPHESIAFMR